MKYEIEVERHFPWYIVAIGWYFLGGWLLQLLWNAIIPELFGLPILGYWQSVGLILVVGLLRGASSYLGKYKIKVEGLND